MIPGFKSKWFAPLQPLPFIGECEALLIVNILWIWFASLQPLPLMIGDHASSLIMNVLSTIYQSFILLLYFSLWAEQ